MGQKWPHKENNMWEFIKEEKSLIVAVLFVVAIYFFVFLLAPPELPVVYWSTSKNECVRIEIKGEEINCDELYKYNRYERVWVK